MTSTYENVNQKGSVVSGGLLSDEALASADLFKDNAYGKGQKGAQQFYTPSVAAELIAAVLGTNGTVFDPTAGDGSLLAPFGYERAFGVEIDPDQIQNSKEAGRSYHAIQADIQQVYALLRPTVSFDAVVMNPPFGLDWSEPTLFEGETKNSALLTLAMAKRLLAEDGQFAFIAGSGRFHKTIVNNPEARGIYAVIDVEDLFDGTRTPAVIAFGVHKEQLNEGWEPTVRKATREMLDLLPSWVLDQRREATGRHSFYASHWIDPSLNRAFETIQKEHDRRTDERFKERKDQKFDVELFGGDRLNVMPSPYANLVLNNLGKLHQVSRLNGASVNYFIQSEREWNGLMELRSGGLLTIDPAVIDRVNSALADTRRLLCPLYPVKPAQRLGFLSDVETLLCVKADPTRGFDAGVRYDLDTRSITIRKSEMRPEQIKSGKRAGEWEDRIYEVMKKALQVKVGHWSFTDTEEDAEDITYLLEHFELPDPGDVSTNFPDDYRKMLEVLDEVESEVIGPNSEASDGDRISFKNYQREDLARLLTKGDGMLAWEQGLGKTLAGAAFALSSVRLKRAKEQVLIICPKDLIPQWQRELKRFVGIEAEVIDGARTPLVRIEGGKRKSAPCVHVQAHNIKTHLRAGGTGWYITYPEALSVVGTRGLSKALDPVVVEVKHEQKLVKGTDRYGYYKTVEQDDGTNIQEPVEYNDWLNLRNDGVEGVGHGYIRARWQTVAKEITSRELCPSCKADRRSGWNGLYCEAERPDGSTCGYAHFAVRVKPMSSILASAFSQGVIINDEATMIQGDDSLRSLSIRGLRAKCKLGMTGTPIKNYVHQAFWPLWWCLGNNSPRFGYGYDDKPKFADNFCVFESYKTKGDNKKKGARHLPEITNLSLFWRQAASSIIRRRKEDTGEPIVPRYFFPISTPLGVNQQKKLAMWAKCFPQFFKEKYPDSPVVKAGMHEVMAPMLGLQQKFEYAELLPGGDPEWEWNPPETLDPFGAWANIEPSNFTPAVVKVMELAMGLAKEGRKVLVGSPLVATSKFLAEQLQGKGVNAIHIVDESGATQDAVKRAKTVYSFQTNDVQVLCTGIQAIRFGHNLDAGSAVILLGLPWDFETMDQFIARVHRLTSTRAVHVYVVLPGQHTVTTRKWELLGLKGGAASLALDGEITKKVEVAIDRNKVVAELMEKGVPVTGDEINESDVEEAWRNIPNLDEFAPASDLLGMVPEVEVPVVEVGIDKALYLTDWDAALAEDVEFDASRAMAVAALDFFFAGCRAAAPLVDNGLYDPSEDDEYEDELVDDQHEQELTPAEVAEQEPLDEVPSMEFDLIGHLRELKALVDEGILDDDEFKEAKAAAIARSKAAAKPAVSSATTTEAEPQLVLAI